MKAFAQFIEYNKSIGIRKNTILQFGQSWEVIGAVWMINPGSSKPLNIPLSDSELEKLQGIDNNSNWHAASIDRTMGFLEKVLNGYYIGEKRELNGIIRVFNIYNLRNPNVEDAMKAIEQNPNIPDLVTIEQDITSIIGVDNVYLGWGNEGKYRSREYAEKIFSLLSNNQKIYCNSDFMKNPFYHPMFVNRGIRFNSTKEWLRKYFEATK